MVSFHNISSSLAQHQPLKNVLEENVKKKKKKKKSVKSFFQRVTS